MKLMYGEFNNIPDTVNCSIFNFNSLNEVFPLINLLPPNNLGARDEYDFDIRYMHWILDIDCNFIIFMNIVLEIYYGRDVYLIIDKSDWSMVIVESLLKLIQQRYGLVASYIGDQEDYMYTNESEFEPTYGIFNFDNDRNRYIRLYEINKLQQNGGKIEEGY